MPSQRWTFLAGIVAVVLLLVAGCGNNSRPGEDVPAIASALGDIDDAIVDGRYKQAQARLAELMDATASAQEAGVLEGSEADRILAAVAVLKSALQQTENGSRPDDAPTESEVPDGETPSDEGDFEEDEKELEKKLEEEQKKAEEERKKLEEEQKQEDKGSGNGDSSENGPDDGEGT